jgi:biopolymer transport protein ExbB
MKRCLLILALLSVAAGASAQDIREARRRADNDLSAARQEARVQTERILNDRGRLTAVVDSLESHRAALEAELHDLERRQAEAAAHRDRLQESWSGRELGFRELSGNVRVAARDLESLLRSSPLTATSDFGVAPVSDLLREGYFPDLDDISTLVDVALDEIRRTGEVSVQSGVFAGRDGRDVTGEILHFGRFTTVYRTPDETGFLLWNPDGQRLTAPADLPEASIRRQLERYLGGESGQAPVDLSGGPALRRIARRPSLFAQLQQGGPIVWPLVLLAVFALLTAVWKAVTLQRVHANTDRITAAVNEAARAGRWDRCREIVDDATCRHSPVARVVRAGLDVREESREIQESVLQEAILHELPVLQRGLALLAVSAAVAPLLGLLGTVTGMIETFRVITLYGTGDPKLMSGGISEALVTTEIGLAVAIPVMLLHVWLKRRVDHVIGDMEEEAVRLVNTVERGREEAGGA